jgi:hypothetical protein
MHEKEPRPDYVQSGSQNHEDQGEKKNANQRTDVRPNESEPDDEGHPRANRSHHDKSAEAQHQRLPTRFYTFIHF